MSTTKEFPSGFDVFKKLQMPVAANFKALKGVPAAVALSGASEGCVTEGTNDPDLLAIGRFGETKDNTGGAAGAITVEVVFPRTVEVNRLLNDTVSPVTAADVGKQVYWKDNNTATSSPTGSSPAGICWYIDPDDLMVRVEPTMRFPAGLGDSGEASGVSIDDTSQLFLGTDAEAALAELAYQYDYVPIPLTSALDAATGALLAAFVGGASTTPGTELTNSKSAAVRWNNDAAPGAIAINVAMPPGLDDAADVTFEALVSKTGATVGDATKLTVGAFEHIVGALHDADTDFGGDTSAVVGNATAKTITKVALTLALADIHAAPSGICLTIKPKAGTLGTDDLVLHEAWLKVKRKSNPA